MVRACHGMMGGVPAQVIVLAGPSGSGKSHLAARLRLPVLRLDDFYRDGDDPELPRITEGANAGLVDWDHPRSWLGDEAVAALATLCRTGSVETPVYSISDNGRTGTQTLSLEGAALVIAEGIFAHHVVVPLRDAGLLAAAYCLRQHPMVTFWRRLSRDLRERRKPPLVLLRRGLALMRDQRRIVAAAVAVGCEPVSADQAYAAVQRLPASETRR
jgi:uridine kinase